MTKQDLEIAELNTEIRVKLAPSKTHGIGVFAIRDIPRGQRVYCIPHLNPKWYTVPWGSMSKLFPEVRELIVERWPSIVNGSHFVSPMDMTWMITFMNHSPDPNYEVKTDMVLKDIKKGEELFEDYRLMENYQKVYPNIDQWQ